MTGPRKRRTERPSPLRALSALLRRQIAEPPAVAEAGPPPPDDMPALRLPPPRPTRAPSRQTSLLEPPESWHADRLVVIQDFIEKYKQTMKRLGIGPRDPLAPVYDMLLEMMVHNATLAADLTADLKRIVDRAGTQLLGGLEQARAIIGEDNRRADRAIALTAERIAATAAETRLQREQVLVGFHAETEALIRTSVSRGADERIWRDRIIVSAFMFAALLGAFVSGQWQGRTSEHEQTKVLVGRLSAALQDGENGATEWLSLIEWNNLSKVTRQCAPEPNGLGYRMACTFKLWTSPPLDIPPSPPPSPPPPPPR